MADSKQLRVFSKFTIASERLTSYRCTAYETTVFGWRDEWLGISNDGELGALFGYVSHDETLIETPTAEFKLGAGQYFCVPSQCRIAGGSGLIIHHHGFRALQQIGGPIEDVGRLRYISGCTDTLLVSPPRMGDPCLNALYFPPNTDQQPHTHPSIRVGIVAQGSGEAVLETHVEPLNLGDIFMILPDGLHSFRTRADEEMIVIAYHPDSDFGPQDEDHPMINRTIVAEAK